MRKSRLNEPNHKFVNNYHIHSLRRLKTDCTKTHRLKTKVIFFFYSLVIILAHFSRSHETHISNNLEQTEKGLSSVGWSLCVVDWIPAQHIPTLIYVQLHISNFTFRQRLPTASIRQPIRPWLKFQVDSRSLSTLLPMNLFINLKTNLLFLMLLFFLERER